MGPSKHLLVATPDWAGAAPQHCPGLTLGSLEPDNQEVAAVTAGKQPPLLEPVVSRGYSSQVPAWPLILLLLRGWSLSMALCSPRPDT